MNFAIKLRYVTYKYEFCRYFTLSHVQIRISPLSYVTLRYV